MIDVSKLIADLSPEQLQLLYQRLEPKREDAPRTQILPRSREHSNVFPLSYGQQRYWFLQRLDPETAAYNVPTAVRLIGTLNVPALEQSLNEIIRRHEVLRSSFQVVDGQPVQVIAPELEMKFELINLERLPESEREAEVWRLSAEEAKRIFNLSDSSLLRAVLLRLTEHDHVLLLTTHHIICDKWSNGVFMQELAAGYSAFSNGAKPLLPSLPVQYADFASWQREQLQGEALDKLVSYWKEKLSGAPASLDLPVDYPRAEGRAYRAGRHELTLDKALTLKLKALSQREDATLFMILLTVFKLLLYKYSGQEKIVIGFLSANRNRPEIDDLIGQFANTLVIQTELSHTQTFRELLSFIHEETLGAYAHQDLPFDKLVEELQPERKFGQTPLFQVAFNLQKAPPVNLQLPGLSFTPFEVYRGPANLDLYLEMEEREQELVGAGEYDADLFDAGTIDLLIDAFRQMLEQCCVDPGATLDQFKLPAALEAKVQASRERERKQTIAITATFTAEPIEDGLSFWIKELGRPAEIQFAPYHQVFQQLLDPSSLLGANQYGVNVVLVRIEDWQRYTEAAESVIEESERNVRELVGALKSASERAAVPFVLCICPASPADPKKAAFYREMEESIVNELADVRGIHVMSSDDLLAAYPVAQIHDAHADQLGHVPYTQGFFAALSTAITRKIYALQSAPYKVIVLDCDNTIWKGVCAEDGPHGVDIDSPRRALQEFVSAQHRVGRLVCLCSKNNEEDVLEVFAQRTDMPLKREHLVALRVNWNAKSENLKDLARELQVGLDSLIFIDDDPVVCAEVRANCPEVLTIHYQPDADATTCILEHVWAFDSLQVTEEDRQRTLLYQQNVERERLRSESITLEDFLTSLGLKVNIGPLTPAHVARVAQLTQRTNQFNSTTIRYSESEIQQILNSEERECLVVDVSDRFGTYGLVGVVIFKADAGVLQVESLLLSCRVLGRGVEHQILRELGTLAQQRGLEQIELRFTASKRNEPVYNFFEEVGAAFKETSGLAYRLPVTLAATCVYRPANLEVEPRRQADQRQVNGAPSARNELLLRIASDLFDSERILQAIDACKRRSRSVDGETFVAPRTPIEEILVDVWGQILGLDQISVNDNFFKLGGHSLLATMLLAKVVDTFQTEFSLRTFYDSPTVAAMAEIIERDQIERGNATELAELMEEMAALSDDEIKALLASEVQLARDI